MNVSSDIKSEDNTIENTGILNSIKVSRCCPNLYNSNSSKSADISITSTSSKGVNGNSECNEYCDKSFTNHSILNPSSSKNATSSLHIDSSKYSNDVTTSNGAKPKTKIHNVCNVPNRIGEQTNVQKLNNNFDGSEISNFQNRNRDISGMDVFLRNNIGLSMTVDSCSPKLPSKSNYRYNEWYSSSEDEEECCFYTYKGDANQMADLPSSFFRLDLNIPKENTGSRTSSPDMDYLEMDFDPGPLNEQDSPSISDSDGFDLRRQSKYNTTLVNNEECANQTVCIDDTSNVESAFNLASKSASPISNLELPQPTSQTKSSLSDVGDTAGEFLTETEELKPLENESLYCSGAMTGTAAMVNLSLEMSKYNILSPEIKNTIDKLDNTGIHNRFPEHLNSENSLSGQSQTKHVMLWKEADASVKQVNQIATSACGATAVVNVMIALNIDFSLDVVKEAVGVRTRKDTAPLPEYLFSRSIAGATHIDIIRGLEFVSNGRLFARFFSMYPSRNFSLTKWLSYWMEKGAVPIATVNLQCGEHPASLLPDFWHHQMIFGVGPKGIYMTNPMECLDESSLATLLCSPSVLKVRRKDVVERWTPDTDLRSLLLPSESPWSKLNVIGQVANMIRENQMASNPNCSSLISHITIPASYSSGITLVISQENPGFRELAVTPELPIS